MARMSPLRNEEATASTDVRRAVLRLQRGVQRLMQAELRAVTGGDTPALERYEREYLREFRRQHELASLGDLVQAILETDVFFVGDYHTLRQSQDLARRLLERAAADTRPLVLAVEMVLQSHQEHLDAYMRGDLGDAEFLEAIRYRRTWNFDWENYRPLFETARRLGVHVVGINHLSRAGRNLQDRDEAIADALMESIRERPQARLMVLVGDLHLAATHLPRALDRRLEAQDLERRRLVVFQNADSLYWSLAERGAGREAQVVRLGPDRYCVMEVPPFVKLQSYLSWERALERLGDTDDGEEVALDQSANGLFEALVRQMARFFGVPALVNRCEVLTGLDEAFFAAVESHGALDERRVREIHLLAFGNRSCFVPELDLVYLPFLSVNHAAEEAMHVLHAALTGPTQASGDAYEDFYARAWDAAVGFLGSKLVNPHRRAVGEAEYREFLRTASRRLHEPRLAFRKLVARFVVQHLEHERMRLQGSRGRLKQIYEQDAGLVLEVSVAVGYLLGERLADTVLSGTLGAAELRPLVFADPRQRPSERYFALHRALAATSAPAPA